MQRGQRIGRVLRAGARLSAALVLFGPAGGSAQVLGGGPLRGSLGDLGGGLPPVARGLDLTRPLERLPPMRATLEAPARILGLTDDLADVPLAELRQVRVRRLLRDHADVVEPDDRGQPTVRGEVLAIAASPDAIARAAQAGFQVFSRERLPGLEIESVVLTVPRGMTATEAVARLRALDPAGRYDFNHIYQESGVATGAFAATGPPAVASARNLRIGLVDGAVEERHPAMAAARLVQRGFAPGGSRPTAHATAVASLIAGAKGGFRGAAPGATLYVADVYGPTPAGGSATAIAQALSWLAQNRTPVINISLVGPPNALLKASVEALVARGHLVVAAVGNDGPAAPALFPAAYPGVVAVTGVDTRRRVLPEAGRGAHVNFAAPGDTAAAALNGGFLRVRGTSFAAPLAAGSLARLLPAPDRVAAARAIDALARQADDLGARGPDPIYGRGLVAFDLLTDPASLGARTALRP